MSKFGVGSLVAGNDRGNVFRGLVVKTLGNLAWVSIPGRGTITVSQNVLRLLEIPSAGSNHLEVKPSGS